MIEEYLISEGYADDYKSAEKIVEAMSDAWYELICEAMVAWREKRGDGQSPYERAVKTRARLSRDATAINQGRKKGDFIQATKNLLRVTKAIDTRNKENPVAPTKGMTGIRGSQTGGVPQATKKQKEGFKSVSTVNPGEQERLAQKAGNLTGQPAEYTPNGIKLRSLGRTRATRDVNKTSRNLGTTTTQPGGSLPNLYN